MKIYRANFDYEYQLYGLLNGSVLEFSKNLECLYFFTESSSAELFTENLYDEEYLEYVEKITGRNPRITSAGKADFWWGSLTNLELEKKLNSKLTSTQFAIENDLAHRESKIIHHVSEISCSSPQMVLKDPHQMAGRGFFQFDQSKITKASAWAQGKCPLIQEPWLKKIQDIGTYCFANGEMISYLNFSNLQGNYKGTRIWADPVDQLTELKELKIDLDLFLEKMTAIREFYYTLGAIDGFSIDSFIYQEGFYYLSEVNYRKTMGWAAYQLKKLLKQHRVGQLVIHKRQNNYQSVTELLKIINNSSIVLISPPKNAFLLFYLCGNDRNDLLLLEEVVNAL